MKKISAIATIMIIAGLLTTTGCGNGDSTYTGTSSSSSQRSTQSNASGSRSKDVEINKFLEHLVAVHPVSTGFQVRFTGKFRQIPKELSGRLKHAFPSIRFEIAKMEYFDLGYRPVNLMIMVDAKSGKPVTYLWDIWFAATTWSFRTQFTRLVGDDADTNKRLTTLADLIAFSMNGSTDVLVQINGALEVPIRDMHNKVWRILQLPQKDEFKYSLIQLIRRDGVTQGGTQF